MLKTPAATKSQTTLKCILKNFLFLNNITIAKIMAEKNALKKTICISLIPQTAASLTKMPAPPHIAAAIKTNKKCMLILLFKPYHPQNKRRNSKELHLYFSHIIILCQEISS